ncbi:hypothetical protein SABIM44S_01168 [Streptomyces abikoensis]
MAQPGRTRHRGRPVRLRPGRGSRRHHYLRAAPAHPAEGITREPPRARVRRPPGRRRRGGPAAGRPPRADGHGRARLAHQRQAAELGPLRADPRAHRGRSVRRRAARRLGPAHPRRLPGTRSRPGRPPTARPERLAHRVHGDRSLAARRGRRRAAADRYGVRGLGVPRQPRRHGLRPGRHGRRPAHREQRTDHPGRRLRERWHLAVPPPGIRRGGRQRSAARRGPRMAGDAGPARPPRSAGSSPGRSRGGTAGRHPACRPPHSSTTANSVRRTI